MKQLYIAILLLFTVSVVSAQDNTMVFTKGIPQSSQVNVAYRPVQKWYLSMPAIGSIGFNTSNSGFSWNDLIRKGTGTQADSLIIDLDYAAGQMQDNNLFATDASLQIIGFGFAVKKWFFTFDINQKMKAKFNYPKSLFDIRYGNWDYDNGTPISHSFSDMYLNTIDYNEIAIGASKSINDKLTVGLKLKYLMGVANVQTEYMNLEIETFENGDMRLSSDASIQTNVPLDVTYDEDGYVDDVVVSDDADEALLSSDNTGWAFDLGATYQLTDKIMLGLAFNDLGYIKWKNQPSRLFTNGVFDYEGVDISDKLTGDDNDKDYLDELSDDFNDSFHLEHENSGAYTTGIMGNMTLSAEYQLAKWANVGLVSKNYWVDKKWLMHTTLGAGVQAGRILSASLTYSYMKNAPFNIGAGMALNLGPVQIYAVTDNLNSAIKPASAKYVNARLGLNFVFNGKRSKEEAAVPVE